MREEQRIKYLHPKKSPRSKELVVDFLLQFIDKTRIESHTLRELLYTGFGIDDAAA